MGLVYGSLAGSYRVGRYTSGRQHRRIGCRFGFWVIVALGSRTIVNCYAQHTGSTVAFLMTRFVCGMVMPKMVTSLFVRLSVHAAVGADVD